MFDMLPPVPAPVTAEWISAAVRRLQRDGFTDEGLDDAARIEQIGLLETLKAVASAVQARRTTDFAVSREAALTRLTAPSSAPSSAAAAAQVGARLDRARRDVGAQIGLARRVSPRIGIRLVGLAKVLTTEMPATMGALRGGRIDEYQATLVAAETAALSLEHRRLVDDELADRFGSMTPAQARGAAARIGYRLDPEQAVRRSRKAYGDRCVTLRPAPDTMTYLTALLPVASGVAAYAALTRHAASATATGDPRSKGALMADEFLARILTTAADVVRPAREAPPSGHPVRARTPGISTTAADPGEVEYLTDGLPAVPAGVSIEIQLVMTDRALFDGDSEPATLTGYGPIPAAVARHLVRGADATTTTWVRRLYADSDTGRLTDADTRRRLFSHAARQFLVARDQVCRTPWCGAPIQHADHTRPHAQGGPTEPDNGAGLCAGCNQTKEGPGWTSTTDCDGSIITITPTGQRHRSHPPDPPRSEPWNAQRWDAQPWNPESNETEQRRRSLARLEILGKRRPRAA
ncbi:MAG: DUF222 domain-containing protein [Nakamurella sp.]